MNTDWNLDNIYKSVSSEEFKRDTKEYKKAVEDFNNWCKVNLVTTDNAQNKLEKYIVLKNKVIIYANLAQTTDTTNSEISKAIDIIEGIESETSYQNTAIVDFVKNIDNLDQLIENSSLLKEHSFYLSEIKNKGNYTLSSAEEAIISK